VSTVEHALASPRRYALLASSITGVETDVTWAEDGDPTWTDGRTIYVAPVHAARVREAVAIQAALMAGGALDATALRLLRRRPAAQRRYLVLEVPRCLDALAARLPPSLPRCALPVRTRSALESARRSTHRARAQPPDPVWGELRPERVATVSASPGVGSAVDLVGELRPGEDDPATPGQPAAPRFGDAFRGGGMVRQRRGRGSRRSSTTGRGHLADRPAPRGQSAASSPTRVVRHAGGPRLTDEPPRRGLAVARYPEWSLREHRYLSEWCSVRLVPVERSVEPVASTTQTLLAEEDLRRQVAALRLELTHVRRSPDGDDVDLDALVEARIDAATSGHVDDRVYIASRRGARDLTALVLVDASGSTRTRTPDATDVLARQRAAAASLVRAFEINDDRVACLGFRSFGRHRVEIVPVKHFAHRFDARAQDRLRQLRPSGFTRLGAAIRHATALLHADAATRHKLLIVLTDGFPFDTSYEGEHAAADSRRALDEARLVGVGPVAISFRAGEDPESLRAVFGTAAHAAAASLRDLAASLTPLFADALRRVERSRV
jgi:Mg-chelatase subunit ChlD